MRRLPGELPPTHHGCSTCLHKLAAAGCQLLVSTTAALPRQGEQQQQQQQGLVWRRVRLLPSATAQGQVRLLGWPESVCRGLPEQDAHSRQLQHLPWLHQPSFQPRGLPAGTGRHIAAAGFKAGVKCTLPVHGSADLARQATTGQSHCLPCHLCAFHALPTLTRQPLIRVPTLQQVRWAVTH